MYKINRIVGVMVSMLTLSAVDRGFESRSVKPKTIKLVFVASPLSTQHSGERTKTGWLGIRNNVSEWGDMSIHGLLFQFASTKNPTTVSMLV